MKWNKNAASQKGRVFRSGLLSTAMLAAVLVLAVLAYTCTKAAPWGYICGGVGLVVGLLKYRNIVQYNSETVKRFKNTYKEEMDVKKFNKFVESHF